MKTRKVIASMPQNQFSTNYKREELGSKYLSNLFVRTATLKLICNTPSIEIASHYVYERRFQPEDTRCLGSMSGLVVCHVNNDMQQIRTTYMNLVSTNTIFQKVTILIYFWHYHRLGLFSGTCKMRKVTGLQT